MTPFPFFRIGIRAGLAALIIMALIPTGTQAFDFPSLFKRKSLAAQEIAIDAAEAARLISAYRKAHGLGPVRLDSRLTRIAADHAVKMASSDKVAHVLRGEGSFARRLRNGGFDAAVAAENLGGGYHSIAEAMQGWRTSREHNQNLLKPSVTLIGIASAKAQGSKYKTYWSLILAEPYVPPPQPSGPSTGPPVLMIR